MTVDLDALERLARAATQGEWGTWAVEQDDGSMQWGVMGQLERTADGTHNPGIPQGEADADFIAAANPAAVLELVQRLRAQDALLHECDRRLRGYQPYADDGPGTLRVRLADALEGREAEPTYDVLRAIVRDLADKESPSYNGTCMLCHHRDEDEGKVNHAESCPWRCAREAGK